MWIKVAFAIIGGIVVGLIGLVVFNKFRVDRINAKLVDDLLADAVPAPERVFTNADLEGLPAPVQRYLRHVLTEGQSYANVVRWEQTGGMRLNGPDEEWKPFTATQHFTVDPPGFVWDAAIQMAPGMPVRVVDKYVGGEGGLQAKILSTVTVANETAGPEINQGELMRYLAEMVWFPTAMLPGQYVTWSPIDDRSAEATLTHEDTTVSLVFNFNEQNEVENIYAPDRLRGGDGVFEPTPWTAQGNNFQRFNEMLLPADGEVAWNLPEGDFTYWRGQTEAIEHR